MISFKCPGGVYNSTPRRVIFGNGSVNTVADEVNHLGCSRALIISTPGRIKMAENVASLIGKNCVDILPEAISQVPIELARMGRERASELDADCLVAVGGGASVGLAKGIAYEKGMPIIDIPTTYSGSEVTGFCGMTIDGVKQMHISLNMLAHTLIYDPALTLSLPVKTSAASAMNALAHCIDAVYVPTVNPVVALAAAEGARITVQSAAEVVKKPRDLEARGKLLYGGYMSGVALTGGFALQHGLAHVLGGTFHIEHGLAHSLSLPYVTAFNSRYVPDKLAPIARALGTDVSNLGGAVYDLLGLLGLPCSLSEIGFVQENLDTLVKITVETDNGYNPAPVTAESVKEIVNEMWLGRRPQ
jgi:maleylacetate reductase